MIAQCVAAINTTGIWNIFTLNPAMRTLNFAWNAIGSIPGLQWMTLTSITSLVKLPRQLGYKWVMPEVFRTNKTLSYVFKKLSQSMPFRKKTFRSDLEQIWRFDLPENYMPYGIAVGSITLKVGSLAMLRKYNRDFFFKFDSRLKKLHKERSFKKIIIGSLTGLATAASVAYYVYR